MRSTQRRGATLIELMITVGVYTFIVLALFALTRDGTSAWKAVETRTSVQSQLRNFERDISEELKRTAIDSIRFWGMKSTDSYKRGILMLSAMNETNDPTNLRDPITFWVDTSVSPPEPAWQRWVLFYLTRPDRAWHRAAYDVDCASYDRDVVPDNICPHKWLIRKDIYLSAMPASTKTLLADVTKTNLVEGKTQGRPFIEGSDDGEGNEPTEASLVGTQRSVSSSSLVSRARVIAKDILSLNFNVLDGNGDPLSNPITDTGAIRTANGTVLGKIILFDVKAFKVTEAQSLIRVGSSELTQDDTYEDGNWKERSRKNGEQFSVQLDNRVVPQNKAFR